MVVFVGSFDISGMFSTDRALDYFLLDVGFHPGPGILDNFENLFPCAF
jgi:hypothetical protein